jgi:hypothetical protein
LGAAQRVHQPLFANAFSAAARSELEALRAAMQASGASAEPAPACVALKLDPVRQTSTWVRLHWQVRPGARTPSGEDAIGVMTCAATEMVQPETYFAVAEALGLGPLEVAPYKIKSRFCQARMMLWASDNDPKNVPGVRIAFNGKANGRWLGTCFLVAYPVVPANFCQGMALPVPGATLPASVRRALFGVLTPRRHAFCNDCRR